MARQIAGLVFGVMLLAWPRISAADGGAMGAFAVHNDSTTQTIISGTNGTYTANSAAPKPSKTDGQTESEPGISGTEGPTHTTRMGSDGTFTTIDAAPPSSDEKSGTHEPDAGGE